MAIPKAKPTHPVEIHFDSISLYHYYIFAFLFISKIPVFWHMVSLIFLSPKMNYKCEGEKKLNVCPCENPIWDKSVFSKTMFTKFNLVCEKAVLVQTAHAVLYSGTLVGAFVFGFLADKFGRLSMFCVSIVAIAIFGCLVSLMPNIILFIIMRFFEGFGIGGAIVTGYVLCVEYCGIRQRELVTALYHVPLNIGHMSLAGVSYLLRDMDDFQMAISVPTLAFVVMYWLCHESPKWLMDSNKIDKAAIVMEKIAKLMTDYERIKASCLERSELWEDPDFPATQTSVFYYQTPPFHFIWRRAKDIFQNPTFVLDKSETFDVVPGKLGDKWLVSCLGVLYLCKGLFYRVVPADQRLDAAYAGVFRFRLWWCGQWMEVLVDDRLPTVNGKLAFLQTTHSEQLWPALLEKAYAKLHGSYEALKYGSLVDGLADLAGGITEMLPIPDIPDAISLKSLLETTSIVTAHYHPAENEDRQKFLELEMNYRICEIKQVETQDGPVSLVRLRRPLSKGDIGITHVVLDNATWISIPPRERDRLVSSVKGFWVLFSDFQRLFPRIEMVHLDAETSKAETSLLQKVKWQMRMYQSGWKRGVSAGGCRNHVNFFHMNPQVQIVLNEPDTVIVSLNQHSIMEPKVIGFSIYKTPKTLSETASPVFFRSTKSTINSQYTNSRQVSHRCELDAGAYLIMPTTFEPREEANFTLRIFSKKCNKMKVLDDPPQMIKAALLKAPPGTETTSFAQYEALFLQLADEHRTINIFELQELLDACLPNDYIKSCASIDTCRQIVLSLDKKGSGRLSLSDFKDLMCSLKHWQLLFKKHAREKMGVLRAERLRDALKDVGFVVPERVMTLLVLRYMRKDGMLRFGDYVSAVLHLHRAFEVFYSNESLHSNSIQVNLSEWLHSAFMC